MQGIVQEIHRPELIWLGRFWKLDSTVGGTFLSPADPDSKLFLPINALCAFFVNYQTLTLQKGVKSATAESLSLLGKLFHPLPKGFVTIVLLFICQGVPAKANKAAGTSLAQPKAVYYINCCFLPCLGL